MELTDASYNIHKGVGLDRRRDPERILAVLREIDADVVALQEADRRFGDRVSVLPRQVLEDHGHWQAVALNQRPDSIGWHGNALLVRKGVEIVEADIVPLPTLEPRGAVRADLVKGGRRVRGLAGQRLVRADAAGRHEPVPRKARGARPARGFVSGALSAGRARHAMSPSMKGWSASYSARVLRRWSPRSWSDASARST